jgi:hypothetical protein
MKGLYVDSAARQLRFRNLRTSSVVAWTSKQADVVARIASFREVSVKSEKVLPILIYCDAGVTIVSLAVNRALGEFYPALGTSHGTGDVALTALWVAVNAATLLAWVGILNLWRPARAIYFWTWVATLLLLPLESAWVFSPVGYMLDSVATLFGGAVLGVLYFSDASRWFERAANDNHGTNEARA